MRWTDTTLSKTSWLLSIMIVISCGSGIMALSRVRLHVFLQQCICWIFMYFSFKPLVAVCSFLSFFFGIIVFIFIIMLYTHITLWKVKYLICKLFLVLQENMHGNTSKQYIQVIYKSSGVIFFYQRCKMVKTSVSWHDINSN